MIKKLSAIFCIFFTINSSQAYQDCVIINESKLTDINIEDNSVIDVFPLITVMNDKNTLIVHPLKTGKTRFCVLRNNKNLSLFNVEVMENTTKISAPKGFDVFSIDSPVNEFEFELDEPPVNVNLTGE